MKIQTFIRRFLMIVLALSLNSLLVISAEESAMSLNDETSYESFDQKLQEELSLDEVSQEEETQNPLPPPPDPPSTIDLDSSSLETTDIETTTVYNEESVTLAEISEEAITQELTNLEAQRLPNTIPNRQYAIPSSQQPETRVSSLSRKTLVNLLIRSFNRLAKNLIESFMQSFPIPQIFILPVRLFLYYLSIISI